jgi:hypothetical protein
LRRYITVSETAQDTISDEKDNINGEAASVIS